MPNILSGSFSPEALTVGTQALGDYQGAKTNAIQGDLQGALQRAQLKRQAEQDQIARALAEKKAKQDAALLRIQSIKSGPSGQLVDFSNPDNPQNVGPAPVIKPARDPVADSIALYEYKHGHPMPGKGKTGRPLPATAVEKLASLDNLISQATDVSSALSGAVKNNVDATGRVLNTIKTPSWLKNVTNKGGDQGKDIRALVGNLFSSVAKERGGSALTPTEIDILETFIPNENEDEAVGLIKANRFIKTLKQMKANKENAYRKYGYGSDDTGDDQEVVEPTERDPILDEYGLE